MLLNEPLELRGVVLDRQAARAPREHDEARTVFDRGRREALRLLDHAVEGCGGRHLGEGHARQRGDERGLLVPRVLGPRDVVRGLGLEPGLRVRVAVDGVREDLQ